LKMLIVRFYWMLIVSSRPIHEFGRLVELAKYSGLTFAKLNDSAVLKDWVDEARIRKTFYGQNKKTI
jgi:hypothetical protein